MTEFFTGVVENRKDPDKLGRYQVRIVGLHNPDKTVLPTLDLPWATPLLGNTSAGLSGIGATPTGLVEGSSVLLMYNDKDKQQPFIVSSVPGRPVKPSEKDSTVGFQDPGAVYPHTPYIEESDLDRNLTGIKIDETSVVDKKVSTVKGIELAGGGKKWDQPPNAYNTKYPYSIAYKSEGAHLVEMDDTYGSERLNILHKTGTYTEMNPDGSMTNRIRGDNFSIVEKSGIIYIKGSCSVNVDGNAYVKVVNALTVDVSGITTVNIMNNTNLNISGSLNLSVVDALRIQAAEISIETYGGDISIKSSADIYHQSGKNHHIKSKNNTNIDTEGLLNLNCGFAAEPKMSPLTIPKARHYPTPPDVGASAIA